MERALVLWNFVLIVSVCETNAGIVEFCVIFFCVPVERALVLWNFMLDFALWYCGILCHIFLRVECALILWKFVLYFYV